jgi:hypothetical protein
MDLLAGCLPVLQLFDSTLALVDIVWQLDRVKEMRPSMQLDVVYYKR